MTAKPDDDAVANVTQSLLAHYSEDERTPALLAAVTRAAQLTVLADRLRAAALRGDEFDLNALARLEALAGEAIAALALPKRLPLKIEITPVEGGPPNLDLLNEKQLATLDEIMSVACGAKPPEPYSRRRDLADELARVLDDAEVLAERPPDFEGPWLVKEIGAAAHQDVRNLIGMLIYPLTTCGLLGLAAAEARARAAERAAADAEERTLHAEHKAASAGAGRDARTPGNVVALPARVHIRN